MYTPRREAAMCHLFISSTSSVSFFPPFQFVYKGTLFKNSFIETEWITNMHFLYVFVQRKRLNTV